MGKIEQAQKLLQEKYVEASLSTNHPKHVYTIVKEKFNIEDEEILISALLHDIIEDSNTSPESIEQHFGTNVKNIILELTIMRYSDTKPDVSNYEKYHKSLLKISNEAKIVKLADEYSKYESVLKSLKWVLRKRLKNGTNPSTELAMREFIKSSDKIKGYKETNELINKFDDLISDINVEINNMT